MGILWAHTGTIGCIRIKDINPFNTKPVFVFLSQRMSNITTYRVSTFAEMEGEGYCMKP